MQIGLLTDSLSDRPLVEAMDAAAELGVETLEIATGNWSQAPHLDLDAVLRDPARQSALLGQAASRGLRLEALNANGNVLHPVTGAAQSAVVHDTIRLAGALHVDTVVMMSGLPAAPGDSAPNWITVCWPPEVSDILEYQWNEVALPYWSELVTFARSHGVTTLALELHPGQLVYNVRSFQRLRNAVGDVVGVNLDPSHLMWMGADPITAIEALGESIYHVHAKDTRIEEREAKTNSCYEVRPFDDVAHRAWNYVTLGRGQAGAQSYWQRFVDALRAVGYDGVLSIEHEDASMPRLDGVRESVDLLKAVLNPSPAGV
jgi:sugar phosphate isomerase/epimerase